MKTYFLVNGLKVMLDKRPGNSVAVEVNVRTGSNNETRRIAGISHYVEHMLFNGTKKRPKAMQIANEIEKLGGEFNAATSNERTFYYIKVLHRHLDVALDIMSDIIFNPLFDEATAEKEKSILLDEINLVNDQPRYYQWILFEKSLFRKHPCRNPVYGSAESIKAIKRKDLVDYHSKYYVPGNMTLVISGNFEDSAIDKVHKFFSGAKKADVPEHKKVIEPDQKIIRIVKEKRNISQSYMVIGYKTQTRSHPDSYVLDVIRAILGRGQSGKIFDEVRNKLALAYDVGVYHNPNADYGFFAVYSSTNKRNVMRIVEIVLGQFRSLAETSENELQEAKGFLEGEFLLHTDDNQKRADVLAFWDMAGEGKVGSYIDSIRKVTNEDVRRVAKAYLKDTYTLVILEQK